MPVDAREQDKTPTKERVTLKVILRGECKANEGDTGGSAGVAAHTAEGNCPPGHLV